MLLSYNLITPPVIEPVSILMAKKQARVDFPDDDTLFGIYVTAAREYAEKYTRRAFFNQTWELALDHFPLPKFKASLTAEERHDWPFFGSSWDYFSIRLPRPTCVSIVSVSYLDLSATLVTLDPTFYFLDKSCEPARLVPSANQFWPYTQQYLPGSIRIKFTAGSYGDGISVNTCPQSIVLAILLLVSHWYEHREDVSELNLKNIPLGVTSLLSQYKFDCLEYGS
jgi:uncharacterized phiE125 gp8 family phage protein